MKKFIIIVTLFILGSSGPPAFAQFGDLFKNLKKTVTGDQGLSEDKIIDGLKEALEIGSKNAVDTVSRVDGFYQNPSIKIPLPETVQKVEKILRTVGYGEKVDQFELSMNRAAEEAAPQAKELFWGAIKDMTVSDGQQILQGGDNAATQYFEDKTRDQLYDLFMPMVETSMSKVNVTQQYQALESKVSSLPFTDNLNLDLEQYVTNGALDGIFKMLAAEEAKIRNNPAARVTDILKEVFGNR